ncbi:MAG: LssY C-terminal domain-containing protein [Nitrospirota bacterium]|nr:MAG: LssY C-terminal domain-containing protein [Nitrospirota bacterium]
MTQQILNNHVHRTLIGLFLLVVTGCASFTPMPLDQVPFMERAVTQVKGEVRVTAAVLSEDETEQVFDLDLYNKGIQPIWLEIENKSTQGYWFVRRGVDPDYFAPLEVAYMNHYAFSSDANAQMDRFFYEINLGNHIPPGSTRSGFVFTTLDEGTKSVSVDLFATDQQIRSYTFFIPVPGLKIDHREIDIDAIYPSKEILRYTAEQEDEFRKAIESLPCCTTSKDGTEMGDPLNLVILGKEKSDDIYHAFMRAGWDETETIHAVSAFQTGISALFGSEYRYSPVSALYVFDRPQDAAFQKARGSIHLRNHLRLWITPIIFDGYEVWIGQISRDIGVRFTTRTVTTHKIDPDVDEAREFLVEDLAYSHGLMKNAYVKGVGAASIDEPRQNLTGDPYFTDGYRLAMWLSSRMVSITNIEFLDWERPPER